MLDYLSATVHRSLMPFTTDNIFYGNPLMMLFLRRMVKVDGGASFAAPIRIGRNTAGSSYSGADLLTIFNDTANTIGAEWNWAQYGRALGVTGLDELRNSGARAIINLIRQSLEAIEMELREDMGTDLYLDGTSNSSKAFVGLAAAIDDGTNVVTYGAISRTTYTNWKANYSGNASVNRALTTLLINSTYENCSKDNDRPTVLMTTHGVYQKYLSFLQAGQRFGDMQSANLGFNSLTYQQRPIIVDEMISTSSTHRIFFLNLKYFTFYTHSGRNFLMVPFMQMPQQDMVVAKILWAGQLCCTSPRMQGVLTDLDVT